MENSDFEDNYARIIFYNNVLLPEWLGDAVVLGEIPSSGNCFLYVYKGEQQGKVFEFEHDGFEFIEAGKDIATFLDYIVCRLKSLSRTFIVTHATVMEKQIRNGLLNLMSIISRIC